MEQVGEAVVQAWSVNLGLVVLGVLVMASSGAVTVDLLVAAQVETEARALYAANPWLL